MNAERYARNEEGQGYRAGHYDRSFSTTAGDVKLKKAYENIEKWRNRPITEEYPYVYVDGIFLKRCWGEEFENISVLVAVGVSKDGYREILGAAEGLKEDPESWKNFFVWLKSRGLTGVQMIIGDKAMGMVESIVQVFPDAK